MSPLQVILLSIIQGLTEFLPVSSSAHLVLVPILFGYPDQGLAFDVAVHFGSLLAVIGYFYVELKSMLFAWIKSLFGAQAQKTPESRLAWQIGFATIPVGLAGLVFKSVVSAYLRNAVVIAISSIFFGILLGIFDKIGKKYKLEKLINWQDVLIIGLAQAVALIPGTSRSGITMTAGLLQGLTRQAAARFSFLLSIPVIFLASFLDLIELLSQKTPVGWCQLGWGVLISFVVAFLSIHWFLKLIDKIGMLPFVIYRVLLGIVLLIFFR